MSIGSAAAATRAVRQSYLGVAPMIACQLVALDSAEDPCQSAAG